MKSKDKKVGLRNVFARLKTGQTTPYVTSETENLVAKTAVTLDTDIDAFKFTLPAKSVITFISN